MILCRRDFLYFWGTMFSNLIVIFAAVFCFCFLNSVEYNHEYLFLIHFSPQQIQGCFGWVLLVLPHRTKEQQLFGTFHSGDREDSQKSWRDLVMPLKKLFWEVLHCPCLIRQSRSCGQDQSLWG